MKDEAVVNKEEELNQETEITNEDGIRVIKNKTVCEIIFNKEGDGGFFPEP